LFFLFGRQDAALSAAHPPVTLLHHCNLALRVPQPELPHRPLTWTFPLCSSLLQAICIIRADHPRAHLEDYVMVRRKMMFPSLGSLLMMTE